MRKLLQIAVIALAVCAPTARAADLPQYSAKPGPYRVLTNEIVLHDNARGKEVPLKIYFPDAPGLFPVVVFSHGLYGSRETYWALGNYWASHGYVSIHPSHDDSREDKNY